MIADTLYKRDAFAHLLCHFIYLITINVVVIHGY